MLFSNLKKIIGMIFAFIVALVVLIKFTTFYMTVAFIAYFLLILGIIFRAKKKIHIPLMALGVFLDICLVLILEVQRSAIASALGGTLNLFQKGHILFSSIAVFFYIPTIGFGVYKYLNLDSRALKNTHRYLGRIAFSFRTVGFVLMFSLLEHVKKL